MVPRLALCFLISFFFSTVQVKKTRPDDVRPGTVLIKLRQPNMSLAHVRSTLPAEVEIETQLGSKSYVLHVPVGQEQQYVADLTALPQVEYAQLDHQVMAQIQPNDPEYSQQWNLQQIGMPEAWEVVTDTSALTIAVLDTGVDLDHPDLQGQLWTNTKEIANNEIDDDNNGFVDDIHGWHFFHAYSNAQALPRQNNNVQDSHGHGTHVAGIIPATGNNSVGATGVSWRARLMTVRVLEDDTFGWESDIIQGINYAIANGARVINLSLGQSQPSPALAEAINQAESQGVLVVAAAGNNSSSLLYPAAYPSVLSVGANNQSNQRADFSAYGDQLDLLAPGVDILSTWNGVPYFKRSGTSMAAPHVTGVAALAWTRFPQLTAADIRFCLEHTTTDIGQPGRDDPSGWGILNAARAVQWCPQSTPVAQPQRLYLPLIASPVATQLDQ